MATIKPPGDPKPSDEVRGPNPPSSVDPGFGEEFRNPSGDVGLPGRVAGRPEKPARPWSPWSR